MSTSTALALAAAAAGVFVVGAVSRALEALERIASAAELVAREATKRETALERELKALAATVPPQEPKR